MQPDEQKKARDQMKIKKSTQADDGIQQIHNVHFMQSE